MTKRNPTAAALAQPQYRQRVRHCPTVTELRALASQADQERGGTDLGKLSPDELTSWLESRQADQWMPPARQMEG